MIQRIIDRALQAPLAVALGLLALVGGGLWAYRHLDIEAYPNPVPPMVEVIAQTRGLSAQETEATVTLPLEAALAGMPGLTALRSQSLFGLADIKCTFEWQTDASAARQEVINRLQFVDLPDEVRPKLSPWSATGEVFRYTLQGEGYTLQELKSAQDWVLERQWRYVPGVIDVVSFGGAVAEFHVEIDPIRLDGLELAVGDVIDAIARANLNVGGQRLTLGAQSFDIRGIGLLRDVTDIAEVVVSVVAGRPVRVQDVAEVRLGQAPRLGAVGQDAHDEVVQGVVLMRSGAQTSEVLAGIHRRLERIAAQRLLPPGMHIVPYYDRGELVAVTTHTVMENMAVGMALVVAVLVAFLGSWRAALITALTIPLALFVAFIGLVATGCSANLISLGAVDFGIVVDSTVIMVENMVRHLGRGGRGSMTERLRAAGAEVARPLGFSTLILAVSFLPLFTMSGVAGVIFAPMARTYAMAIGGGIVLALTLTPTLFARLMPVDFQEREGPVLRALHRIYDPLFSWALGHPRLAHLLRLLPIVLCVAIAPLLGREFMPKLEEGNLYIRATLPTSVSLEQASAAASRMRDIVLGCPDDQPACSPQQRQLPEVVLVQSQLGRPDDGTDVTGLFNIELFAPLLPPHRFRPGWDKPRLIAHLQGRLQRSFVGTTFAFSQMIGDNVEEAVSGVKGENAVKVFGADLADNEATARAIIAALAAVPGIVDVSLVPSRGQPAIEITPDRTACARFGLNTGDVDAVVQAALGGRVATQLLQGERVVNLTVRWQAAYRTSLAAIEQVRIPVAGGGAVVLRDVADIAVVDGFASIYRENGRRYTPVRFAVRGRDLAGAIAQAQRQVAEQVPLRWGTSLSWDGEMGEMHRAEARLALVVPLTLALIGLLVLAAVRRPLDALIVMVDVPVACTGGLLALWASGQPFSVAAAMGFVSVLGIAVQDAILVVTYFQRLHLLEGRPLVAAARQAAEQRFRPVLMTTLVAVLGLLPAALSSGIGAQTQRPLATVVIGGSLFVAMLTRVLQPTLLVSCYAWQQRRQSPGAIAVAP